jgi:hypothetical protein
MIQNIPMLRAVVAAPKARIHAKLGALSVAAHKSSVI